MLLDYHALDEQPAPAPAPPPFVWMPTRKKKVVIRATMDAELPAMEMEATATVRVIGNIDAAMEALVALISAHASTIPPTSVTELDLDLQDSGIPEDELVLLMAAALLLRMREDDDD